LRQRIATAVSKFSLQIRDRGQARVGISIGTATFGVEGETLDQLLVAADQAMYREKSGHKLDKISQRQPIGTSASLQKNSPVEIGHDDLLAPVN